MIKDFDFIVLGLGGIGSGAAYWLARRLGSSSRVLGLEQFALGHSYGGSQDHSRIIRHSYHTPGYVRLTQRAYDAWDTLAEEAQEQVVIKTGGLDLSPSNSLIPLDDYTSSLAACEIPFELLSAAEIMQRWPQFHLTEGIRGLYQADGGIAAAAKANAAHQRMAQAHGATLVEHANVTAIQPDGDTLFVVTDEATYSCGKLIIAAGAWSNHHLAHLGLRLPLLVNQEQVTYFNSPHLADYAPERFPVWIWLDEPCYYGFPVYGEAAVKVAQDVGGRPVTPETRTFEADPEGLARLEAFVAQYLPTALGPHLSTKTCLYTLTPDRDFVIDHVPGHANVLMAVGAGHAFKFASVIGQILSELAIDGRTPSTIADFRANRAILLEENPSVSYMV